jgi:surface carbohydrate biosynthesis protein
MIIVQDIDILYMYEHVARELDVACAVKCIAEQHYDIRIELVQYPYGLPQAFGKFRPLVVVVPFFYDEPRPTYFSCLLEWRKSVYLNLAWEQLLYEGNRGAKTPRGELACNHVIHQAWSDSFADYLQEQGIPEEHIFVNGNLVYTLYEEPYRQGFEQRIDLALKYQLDSTKRWIFFPENYNWAFYPKGKLESFIQQGLDRDEVFALKSFCRLSLEEVIKWCSAVASHGNVEFIVRPRPSTPLNDFRAVVRQIIPAIPDRLHFIKEGSVREWIMASDIVISSYSTSLIEAAIAGRTTYMLEPYPILESLCMDWHDLVTHIKTQSEFENACLNRLEIEEDNRLGTWARTTMMAQGDSIWNLVDFLDRICRGEIRCPPFPTRKSATPPGRSWAPTWLLFEYRRICWKRKRRHAATQISHSYEKDVLSHIEIERGINKWRQVLAGYDARKRDRDALKEC